MNKKAKAKTAEYPDVIFSYIVISDLPKEQIKPFNYWMNGQTFTAIMEEREVATKRKLLIEKKGNVEIDRAFDCAYYEDYERWYNMVYHNKPTYFD